MAYQKHLHLPVNILGHDYIVGDIHGCHIELMELLEYIGFNTSTDRLISCGDTIDKGPKSIECAELIYNDWFHLTIGNHELMMIQSILKNDIAFLDVWKTYGGLWHESYTKEELYQLAWDLAHKPMVISVGENEHRFNICHAELVHYDHYHDLIPIDNSWIDEWKFNTANEDDILWGRNIIDSHYEYKPGSTIYNLNHKQFHSKDLSPTYVGHSWTQYMDVRQFQQHIYLDTGCYNGFSLSIASPTRNLLFQRSQYGNMITKPLNEIPKINIPI